MKAKDREQAKQIIAGEYDLLATVWDEYFVLPTTPIRERLLELARFAPGEGVLDIGTGTGAAALAAAQQVGKEGTVVGIDMSGEMLKQARAKATRLRLANVEFQRADAISLTFPAESFDAVISCLGTPEGASDHGAALVEWRRVLEPGGRLCFCEGTGQSEAEQVFDGIFAKYRVTDPSPELAARRRLKALTREAAKDLPALDFSNASEVKQLIEGAGFREVRIFTETFENLYPNAQAALDLFLLWASAEYAAMPREVQKTLRHELSDELRALETPHGFGRAEVGFALAVRAV